MSLSREQSTDWTPANDDSAAALPSRTGVLQIPATRANLFLTGFVILFLELACIRWYAAHVIFLQFFTNIVLIACFLGMSLGCLCARGKRDWLAWFPYLSFATICLALLTNTAYHRWSEIQIDVGNQQSPDVVFFGTEERSLESAAQNKVDLARFVIPMEVIAGVFFILIALQFIGPGQVLGNCMDDYPNRVVAYTMNILGSLAGIACFAALSYFCLPAGYWFGVGAVIVAYFLFQAAALNRERALTLAASLTLIVLADSSWMNRVSAVEWSPYYRIGYLPASRAIEVNNIDHQAMYSWDEPASEYSLVHLLNRDSGGKPFSDVLIIGAGSGNDVSHALRHGVERIDAVEIDPVIQSIGRKHHPEKPYADPRVHAFLNDGRNFLRTTDREYDLVTYALVDSLILHSSYSNIRLESFLFTREAFEDVRDRLKPGGVFAMYNYFRQGWIVQRAARMLEEVFGEPPMVISLPHTDAIGPEDSQQGRLTVFLAGDIKHIRQAFDKYGTYVLHRFPHDNMDSNGFHRDEARPAASTDGPAADVPSAWKIAPVELNYPSAPVLLATDNWPSLYLREPMLPMVYLKGIVMLGALSLALLWWLAPEHKISLNGRMFFLGAAFMLLETKAVVHLALLFGSTWIVNSLVFFSILIMILLSNLYVLWRRDVDLRWHYAGLLLSLIVNVFVPLDVFMTQSIAWKYVASCAMVMVPVFFAGVIFAVSFRQSQQPDRDFGANIAGAMAGGFTEYLSMVLGLRYLLLIAAGYYALSAVLGRRK